eukprot:TRINITY_DN24371_c0_g1_i1.p1 TRINITY_DN24371_c0_g1~~TRINITY_DN24371_c0_g1_i1.p1  ORF type:complete len:348 (+),score=83.85 TRINITY_DN24371_c0_g1_i1:46-1089(+)
MKRSLDVAVDDNTREQEEADIDTTEVEQLAKECEKMWNERLKIAEGCAKKTMEELKLESEALSKQRYGDSHMNYSPEPDSITIITELSVRNANEENFAKVVDTHSAALVLKKAASLEKLQLAKKEDDKANLRHHGQSLNTLNKKLKSIQKADTVVGKRIHLCNRKLGDYRSAAAMRDISPDTEKQLAANVLPNTIGYQMVLDLYRLSDAQKYSFGRQQVGAQHYTDIRRNVAILSLTYSGSVFTNYSVSGKDGVGVPPDSSSLFESRLATDDLGETYDRCYDAEFKLISFFLSSIPEGDRSSVKATGTLWSKKPLCESCDNVLNTQLPKKYPGINLTIVIDDNNNNS